MSGPRPGPDPTPRLAGPRQALAEMLMHAAAHTPYYRDQDWATELRAGKTVRFQDIPITQNASVKKQTESFYGDMVPTEEGAIQTDSTSGTTGEPIWFRITRRALLINGQENGRLRSGWGLHLHRKIVHFLVPHTGYPSGTIEDGALPNGGRWWSLYTLDSHEALELLKRSGATAAYGLPSILTGALQHAAKLGQTLAIKQIWTYGEVIPDEMWTLVHTLPGLRVVDQYGCNEAGLIALRCPDCAAYHPADRQVRLELISADGRPAEPGEAGRVVITPFFNRAMPLVRYDLGDYAVKAPPNGCPRSPVAIERILGRRVNLFILPDGRRIRPLVSDTGAAELGIRRFKLFQTTLIDVELHYVPQNRSLELTDSAAQALVDSQMPIGFRVRAVKVAEIPRALSGKYLIHESLV